VVIIFNLIITSTSKYLFFVYYIRVGNCHASSSSAIHICADEQCLPHTNASLCMWTFICPSPEMMEIKFCTGVSAQKDFKLMKFKFLKQKKVYVHYIYIYIYTPH
jgi:hypothetical protein